jgi:hypothetical protein
VANELVDSDGLASFAVDQIKFGQAITPQQSCRQISTEGSSVAFWTTRLCIIAWPSLIRPGNRLCTVRPRN